jgi:hypothetical protein
MYYKEYCKGVQNITIDAIHAARTSTSDDVVLTSSFSRTVEEIPLFDYVPEYVDKECEMVNRIVGRVIGDPHFSWYESKYNGLNRFGIPPISTSSDLKSDSNTVTFAKIVDQDGRASPGSPGLLYPGQAMLAGDTDIIPKSNVNLYNRDTLITCTTIPDPDHSLITNLWIELDNKFVM